MVPKKKMTPEEIKAKYGNFIDIDSLIDVIAAEVAKRQPSPAPAAELGQTELDRICDEVLKRLPPSKEPPTAADIAAEVIKTLPPTLQGMDAKPVPTAAEVAAEVKKLIVMPTLDELVAALLPPILKELPAIIPHPVENELIDKVQYRIAGTMAETMAGKINTAIAEYLKKLPDMIDAASEEVFKKNGEALKQSLIDAVKEEPAAGSGAGNPGGPVPQSGRMSIIGEILKLVSENAEGVKTLKDIFMPAKQEVFAGDFGRAWQLYQTMEKMKKAGIDVEQFTKAVIPGSQP
ncbi:MAG: hypothetical protein JW967_02430 [Dehalococcoidales bacterium]|nr:hypothetical protein [Dehalococcoidales bacterium]